MDKKEALKNAISEVEGQQKKILRNFINTGFLKFIGSALVYLNDKNLTEAAMEKMVQPQDRKFLKEYVENHAITDDEVLDNVSTIFDIEEFNSSDIIKNLKSAMNENSFVETSNACEEIYKTNPLLVEVIRNNTFVFEDILLLDDRNMQRVLRNIDQMDLVIALKNSTEALRERIFSNMSERAAQMLKEDMEFMGAVKVSTVKEKQILITEMIRDLIEREEVFLETDAYVI